ncbi:MULTISPECIES: transglycosylase [Bacillus cereus group]|uniref:transglycosylase n=1 Tax=Bacillus cereus group TaxID=86661 RepID=UPI0018CE10A7|nr:transglycosylase [Bacillus thuringiensis]MBG9520242.1 transglycosylase [Bacillus thuringiensis]
MQPIKAQCEKCNHVFTVRFHKLRLSNQVDKHFFICPNCKEEYVSYYSNRKMRQLQDEISEMYSRFRKCKTEEEAGVLDMKLQKRQAEYERIRDELKTKVEGE